MDPITRQVESMMVRLFTEQKLLVKGRLVQEIDSAVENAFGQVSTELTRLIATSLSTSKLIDNILDLNNVPNVPGADATITTSNNSQGSNQPQLDSTFQNTTTRPDPLINERLYEPSGSQTEHEFRSYEPQNEPQLPEPPLIDPSAVKVEILDDENDNFSSSGSLVFDSFDNSDSIQSMPGTSTNESSKPNSAPADDNNRYYDDLEDDDYCDCPACLSGDVVKCEIDEYVEEAEEEDEDVQEDSREQEDSGEPEEPKRARISNPEREESVPTNQQILPQQPQPQPATQSYRCSAQDCQFTTPNRMQLFQHFNLFHRQNSHYQPMNPSTSNHHQPNRLICPFTGCGKTFTEKCNLKTHERFHLRIKPYRCRWPGCRYASEDRGNTTRHIRVKHFRLPPTQREQVEKGIVDRRDPKQFLEVIDALLRPS